MRSSASPTRIVATALSSWALAWAAAVVFAAAPFAAAAQPGGRPTPQKLWQEFPLDPAPGQPRRAPARREPQARQSKPEPIAVTTAPPAQTGGDDAQRAFELAALGLAGAIVAVGATLGILVYRRRPSRPAVTTPESATAESTPAVTDPPPRQQHRPARVVPVAQPRPFVTAGRSPRPAERARADRSSTRSLKAGLDPTEAARLKAKLARDGVSGRARDADEFKEKLKRPRSSSRKASAPPAPVEDEAAADSSVTRSTDVVEAPPRPKADLTGLRDVPSVPKSAALIRAPAPEAGSPTCRIGLWRGYIRAHFYAALENPHSEATEITASSPYVRWWKPGPPPADASDIAAAHGVLLDTLEATGWKSVARGEEWFALTLAHDEEEAVSGHRAGGSDGTSSH
jgi:hypothetical protein